MLWHPSAIILFVLFVFLFLILLFFLLQFSLEKDDFWIFWRFFRNLSWFIYSVYNCIILYRCHNSCCRSYNTHISTRSHSLLVYVFYHFKWGIEILLPFRSLYPLYILSPIVFSISDGVIIFVPIIKYDFKILELEIVYYIFLNFCPFTVLSFLFVVPVFRCYILFADWNTSFDHS